MAHQLGLTLRTLRHLRPQQVVARSSFVLERRVAAARPAALARRYARQLAAILPTTSDAARLWRWPPAPLDPAARSSAARADELLHGRFTFLNEARSLPAHVDWSPPGSSRLWRFQLHSFGYAVDLAAAARRRIPDAYPCFRALARSWLAAHPVGDGDAWHPFVVAGRLVAWLVARDLLGPALASDPSFASALRRALLTHALYLAEHVEVDVGGNHLLKNGVALLLAGCAFEGPRPARWREQGARILRAELGRQVLADGGHFERSPMYHLLVLADLLAALFAAGRRELAVADPLADAVRRMQRFARTLVHPDGDIPLFNDAALGEAPRPAALLGPSTEPLGDALPASGYFRLPLGEPGPGGVLIADCGAPGPDDLLAHAHADALAFELSVGGRRVLVDGGVHGYEPGPLRDHLRGTAAHNTLQLDGRDQSELWASFRVGRRARVTLEQWSADDGARVLAGSHDGYARLGARHARRIDAVAGSGWRIQDTLSGDGEHVADSRLRLHPSLGWRPAGDEYLAADSRGEVVLRVRPFGRATAWVERGWYAERFGALEEVEVLRLRRAGRLPLVFGCWLLLPGAEPAVV